MLPVLPRFFTVAAAAVAAGSLLFCSGCGKSAADAHSPPPQTLSEPVPAEAAYKSAPALPDYSAQSRGMSAPLPTFVEPPPAPAPALAATPAPASAGPGAYHTLAKGETLYALSRKYNVQVSKIIAANQFKDPNRLAIGTKVYIPN